MSARSHLANVKVVSDIKKACARCPVTGDKNTNTNQNKIYSYYVRCGLQQPPNLVVPAAHVLRSKKWIILSLRKYGIHYYLHKISTKINLKYMSYFRMEIVLFGKGFG